MGRYADKIANLDLVEGWLQKKNKHPVNLLGNNAQTDMLLFPIKAPESGCKDFTTFGKILLKRYKSFATQDVQKSGNLCVLYILVTVHWYSSIGRY